MKIQDWIRKNCRSLSGRTVLLSGSTGGIGRELAWHIASLGGSLILLDRNYSRSCRFADELRGEYSNIKVECLTADMSEMKSVVSVTDQLMLREIDYVILNAGAYSIPRCITDSGYDNVFQINFVSPFYITKKLLPMIRARGGRVVAVGSIAHNYSRIDESDIDFQRRKKASLVYGNAKRYLTYSLMDLSDGDVIIAHPGISFTGITNHYHPVIFALIKHPMKIIFMKPKRASLSILYALFADAKVGEWIGPRFFDVWGVPSIKALKTADTRERAKIVEIAEEIYNKTNIK